MPTNSERLKSIDSLSFFIRYFNVLTTLHLAETKKNLQSRWIPIDFHLQDLVNMLSFSNNTIGANETKSSYLCQRSKKFNNWKTLPPLG